MGNVEVSLAWVFVESFSASMFVWANSNSFQIDGRFDRTEPQKILTILGTNKQENKHSNTTANTIDTFSFNEKCEA